MENTKLEMFKLIDKASLTRAQEIKERNHLIAMLYQKGYISEDEARDHMKRSRFLADETMKLLDDLNVYIMRQPYETSD